MNTPVIAPLDYSTARGVRPAVQTLTAPTRLSILRESGLLDGAKDPVLDRLTRLASRLLGVPIVLVSLVDDRGQHFPGLHGLGGWAGEARGTPLSHSYCQHVVTGDEPLIIENSANEPLVRENGATTELGVVAYAGIPLRTSAGETLGALCAIDAKPVRWTLGQIEILEDLTAAAMSEIELRVTANALLEAQAELQKAHDAMRDQAMRDPLTGLLNRRGFLQAARQHAALAERMRTPYTVFMMDLDAFKGINDTYGHDSGDCALEEMAALLRNVCRESDIVARLGGDEFALVLTGTSAAQVERARTRVNDAIARRNAHSDREYRLASSIGAASWHPDAPAALDALLKHADTDMYDRKRARKAACTAASSTASV